MGPTTRRKIYWIDTGFLVQNWHRLHKKRRPQSAWFWQLVDEQLQNATIQMPKIAYNEIMEKYDDLAQWCETRREYGLCVPASTEVQAEYKVVAAHVELTFQSRHQKRKSMSGADLWVVAYARATPNKEGVAVTQEDPAKKHDNRVKIPTVCQNLGVKWKDTYLFLNDFDEQLGGSGDDET